ncbi:GPI mannosyltransferase 2 protein [Dioscorea alata]|uniref:GPI mannosyltransferase 2 protein n=3 Tax=Dioscorea alata TaxID=55571 RepID=A0ACB7W859_DIOAL|nr:GPI mannosyltransferase 2 protein [Dioscorea alata]KAH7683745.1 GPI mannosyltransferase 2 protein [Dioscorea alata]KAH7683746.1 GPI mannosyltransferase 2 protein [Dioscorea alata]
MANGIRSSASDILRLAFISRFLILTLIVLFRFLFDPYDTSAALNPPCHHLAGTPPPRSPLLWPRVAAAIEQCVVWDSVYFVRIAECGYEYEQTFAFLPLLPAATSLLSRSVLAPLVPVIGCKAVLALAGYVINNVAFIFAALYFYRLSVLILKDYKAAFLASVLFCFNPASVFYSSIYSESLYALFSLGGIYYVFSGSNTLAMLLLAVSGSARSNGTLNAGYFMFLTLVKVYEAGSQNRKIKAVKAIVDGTLYSICIFIPYVAFQAYGYSNICKGGSLDELRPWCKARIPHLYAFLQSHYWGVGFFRYFQVKQLPNFLLASPILTLAVCSISKYAKSLPQVVQALVVRQGNNPPFSDVTSTTSTAKDGISIKNSKGGSVVKQRRKENGDEVQKDLKPISQGTIFKTNQGYYNVMVLPFILHLGFLTFTAFFVMHVQVSTRFLSASPPIYWFASYTMLSPDRNLAKWGYLISAYFILYILLGSLLFSNFYPFT